MRKILLLFIMLNLCGFAAEKINYSDIKYVKGKYYNENGIMNGEYEVVFDKAETKTYESVMDGRKFEYKVFQDVAGGHGFDRIDSKESTDIRFTIHKFLERYMNPPKPFRNEADMRRAAYRF